jgi:predicted PurR-regulated permease PerM
MQEIKLKLPGYLKAVIVLTLIGIILAFLILGRPLLIPIFMAGFIAILLTPISDKLEKKKVPRIGSAIISLFSGLLIIGGIIILVVNQVVSFSKDIQDVGDRFNNYLLELNQFFIENFGLNLGLENGFDQQLLLDFIQSNGSSISGFIFSSLGSLSSIVLLPVFVFFFLIYRDHLQYFILNLFENEDEALIKAKIFELREIIQNYVIGMSKVMAILAVLNTLVLFGLGIQHAVFFGVFAALLNIIPYLGPFLGAILPMLFAFLTKDSFVYPLLVVGAFTLIQALESNILTPKIVGNNVNLNPFITLIGLLLGAAIWGIIGMILIIPTLAVLRKIFELNPSTRPYALLLGEEIHQKIMEKSSEN